MRIHNIKAILIAAVQVASLLLLGTATTFAQQTINLTAGPTSVTLPDGSVVPMWGYSCGTVVTGATATCAALNPHAPAAVGTTPAGWSPVVITVATGQPLTINLTNHLSFTAGTGTNTVPTSLVIVGQLGGGLGTTPTSVPSPDHSLAQEVTWPIATPGVAANTPPVQGTRVQSFSTQVAFNVTTSLTWAALRPGTYLIESGTHPSIQGPMGLYGILVVTTAPVGATPGTAYPAVAATATTAAVPAVTYNAEIPMLFSEIDPVQNKSVNAAVTTAGFNELKVWSGQPGGCGNPSSTTYHTCYPPAVNYTPLYYFINGVAFNKNIAANSLFPTLPATSVTGNVLVRFVNAGLRMHVPSIVGAQTADGSATGGFSLIAEDGNHLPGVPRIQSEVFMAAGKTYDVLINAVNVPAATSALPVFDRELSLSGNATARDAGMVAYIGINGSAVPADPAFTQGVVARADTYNSVIAGRTLNISDPSKGVIANDTNVYGVTLLAPVTGLTLNRDGTFTYTGATTSFTYCANGTVTAGVCSSGITAVVTLGAAPIEAGGITVRPDAYSSTVSNSISVKAPGVLVNDTDAAGYPLSVAMTAGNAPVASAGLTLTMDPNGNGAFNASVPTCTTATGCVYTFTYKAVNSQGTVSASTTTATLTFMPASNLSVTVKDGTNKTTVLSDYRWVIEEDRTFYVNPNCTTTSTTPLAGCPSTTSTGGVPMTFGTNFHTSYMPVVATGCTGTLSCESGQTVVNPATGVHSATVCDVGDGVCRTGASQQTVVLPSSVHLDPTKRYYISVLPGDAANSFENLNNCLSNPTPSCGHGMGGAPIAAPPVGTTTFAPVTVYVQPNPFPPSKLSVFVFEDDEPLNGEHDSIGNDAGVNFAAEPGLGHFNITLFDDAGGPGDATGQMTYDMFNQNLANSLAGTVDPLTGLDACPISTNPVDPNDPTSTGITGTIVTCPTYEADGKTASPLAGQAVVANLMPGRYGVVATPGADLIAKGQEWLQTNTLDGQKAHDSFLRIGEPSSFQEYGPAGYHVSIGFANPAIINSRLAAVCNGSDPTGLSGNCRNTLTGVVTTSRMSRTPDERLFSSGDNTSFSFTQCYVSFGDPDGEDFAFTKCAADGSFSLAGLPDGDWRVTVFDQWNDMLVDGLSTPVRLANGATKDLGQIATNQWQANIYTKTFIDTNGNGIQDGTEPGLTLVPTNIRFRDGSYSNFNNTDLSGNAGFNEIFPLFSWYVVESDTIRYKNSGTHVVYDAGGPSDGSTCGGSTGTVCGSSAIAGNLANTAEQIPVPSALRVPGAKYCAVADCLTTGGSGSTGRIDPSWVETEGWQGFSGQNSFIEFGKKLFVAGETGGIHGEVIYASTRPFDDPTLLIHTSWTPNVPGVTINLYQEGTAPDGTQSLKLVDTTKTSSWDDWAQGFRSDGNPNMNCPGQGTASGTNADLFFFTLFNQPMYLDVYNNQHSGTPLHTVPNSSQFKCYDGMHNWNQVQPAPYDGKYEFPSIVDRNPATGVPQGAGALNGTAAPVVGSNCLVCVANPTDGTPMLPPGKYVVEMVIPPGYELVKEEDKNILIGDNYIAPVTQEFGGLGNVFILPDQAEVSSLYNATNAQNPTDTFGRTTLRSHEGDTGSVETFWPCVGQARVVPDYISLFPKSLEVAPFAGATRNLCDRKEVTLNEQASALAKFWVFTSAHVAAHFTGVITDDYTSEFDPFSPQFGEKFSPPNLPISIKDWTGTEISRVYTDQWGTYDGLTYSTWEVNPPNPTGYAPTMMVTCMNDPGPIPGPNGTLITDPLFNPQYSQFCYEIPFMPGQTQYMDTPVVPTSAFAGAGYNNPDCAYPDLTPAIKEVDSQDGVGPWVASNTNRTITITSLGIVSVPNNAYSGPSATAAPYNQKTITRNYGFGASGTVTIGGVNATVNSWSDTTIVAVVPGTVPPCPVQQQNQYGGPIPGTFARCGQLVITRGDNHKQSIDAVTIKIGGPAPTHVDASQSIQDAIDFAAPGDLIIIDPTCSTTATGPAVSCTATTTFHSPAAHNEMLIMWKPVQLQGVGAASSIINANTHPAGKLDVWRQKIDCLFGLGLNGSPVVNGGTLPNPFDPTGAAECGTTNGVAWGAFNQYPGSGIYQFNSQVDRLPLEATVGWVADLNGNLAEQLQEPSLMGALEGAAITVLGKGVNFSANAFDPTLLAGFPPGTPLLANTTSTTTGCGPNTANAVNPFPSNFWCNPSGVDGLGIQNSSQGGGGIFVHGWAHMLQIANNRINNNAGTLSGGINVGQGEYPPATVKGNTLNAAPYDTRGGYTSTDFCANQGTLHAITPVATGAVEPYCFNVLVNVHNNYVTSNSSTGDELFSATPAGAGGVSICTGNDYYLFDYNWVCGNLSSGDGGGLGHIGYSFNGDIEHNSILFNQSTNPTIPANGGGMIVMGAPDADIICTGDPTVDLDCAAVTAPGGIVGQAIGPSDGTGPNLLINANLIMGNAAESGSGGGIAFQAVNGSDVVAFPTASQNWNSVLFTNNIVTNNVAGWDGAGISLEDSLNVNIINNTIISNDTTASSGVLFNTIGAPLASVPCDTTVPATSCPPQTTSLTTSQPQPAGLVVIQNSAILTANLPATVTCPPGHFTSTSASNGNCRQVSIPRLDNDVIYQNRDFHISVGALGAGTLNQQNVVALLPTLNQTTTGQCASGAIYWDLGVRGDTGPGNHSSTFTLAPTYSFLTSTSGYAVNNSQANPAVVSQYCNGSRVPPELKTMGYQVPPGISDATVPNPIFNLTPAATVDEGNNWINISWGPLAATNPVTGTVLGNYAPASAASPTVNYIAAAAAANYNEAPPSDFFGNPRKNGFVDAGAVEFVAAAAAAPVLNSIAPNTGLRATVVPVTLSGSGLTGATSVTVSGTGVTVSGVTATNDTTVTATFTVARTAGLGAHNVTVTTPSGTSNAVTFTVLGATAAFAGPTPALTTGTANTTTKNGTITVTNTATGANAGPLTLTAAPTITRTAGTGTFSITGGTCVSGFVINPVATSSCTILVRYVPSGTATSTAHVTIAGTGIAASPLNSSNFNGN
jgi:hypothetical protein